LRLSSIHPNHLGHPVVQERSEYEQKIVAAWSELCIVAVAIRQVILEQHVQHPSNLWLTMVIFSVFGYATPVQKYFSCCFFSL
jgi:formate-dependent nitrite reductase membrane component NrfD